jgi:hypothetical protein
MRKSRKNCFRLETLFGRQFYLSGLKATSLGSGSKIARDRIELRK